MQELDPVLARLERLERDNRRWKRASAVVAMLLAGSLAAGFATPEPSVVEAEKFVLRGADGSELGVWQLDQMGNPYLLLQREKASAILTLSGPALNLRAEDGRTGTFLGVDSEGASRMELRSQKYVDGVRAVTKADGSSGLYFLNGEGRERTAVELLAEGNTHFTTRDGQGRVRALFGQDVEGIPHLVLLDEHGRRRIGMLVQGTEDGRPVFALEDSGGRTRAQLALDRDGSASLHLIRPDGQPSFSAP